jgi:PhzF family phenazine biosynthesis protein
MQMDVFTDQPGYGNPLAVVLDGDGLTTEAMQRFASWTNLSETAFVLPPTVAEADYRVRIFTPTSELPFAGHPTVGTAFALLESGRVEPKPVLVQECGAGLLKLRVVEAEGLRHVFVLTPPAHCTPLQSAQIAKLAEGLGAKPVSEASALRVDVGPVWLVAELHRAEDVHRLVPNQAILKALSLEVDGFGITVFGRTDDGEISVYTRSFAPLVNVAEDPVCGSGNASVAAFLQYHGRLSLTGNPYTAGQGEELGRKGRITVQLDPSDGSIEIGGQAVTCIEGTVRI